MVFGFKFFKRNYAEKTVSYLVYENLVFCKMVYLHTCPAWWLSIKALGSFTETW